MNSEEQKLKLQKEYATYLRNGINHRYIAAITFGVAGVASVIGAIACQKNNISYLLVAEGFAGLTLLSLNYAHKLKRELMQGSGLENII